MPIEVRELHIRVVVQDTSEATPGSPGGELAVEGDTRQDHKNWIDVTAMNMGGHKPGGGAAGDDAPTEEISFNYAQAEVQRTEGGGDFLFQADANATGGVSTGGGRDILIGGAGADHIDATNNRGRLLVGVDDVHLQAPGSDIGDSLVVEDSPWANSTRRAVCCRGRNRAYGATAISTVAAKTTSQPTSPTPSIAICRSRP